MSHILDIESCTLWCPPGAMTVCFLAEELPGPWDPKQRSRPHLLSDISALLAGSSPLGPAFSCPGDRRQALFQSFGDMHIDTAKEGIPSRLDYLVRYYQAQQGDAENITYLKTKKQTLKDFSKRKRNDKLSTQQGILADHKFPTEIRAVAFCVFASFALPLQFIVSASWEEHLGRYRVNILSKLPGPDIGFHFCPSMI